MAPFIGLETENIKEEARKELLGLLEGVRGKKNLVLDKSLSGLINIFVKFSTLQDYGVDKVFWLENGNVDSSQVNVVFLARGEKAQNPQAIAEQIKRLQSGPVDHHFSVFWTPRRTLLGDKIFENEGVLGDVSISELHVHFVPLEKDLLSLELDDSFSDLYLRRDPTPVFLAAKALMALQSRSGIFPRIIGKGDNARRLTDLMLKMRAEARTGEDGTSGALRNLDQTPSPHIESLIVIDREIDFATVLLTQLTYEGLLDEVFSIQNNTTDVDISIVGTAAAQPSTQGSTSKDTPPPQAQQGRTRKIQLDSSDRLFEQLRDTNFAIVGPLLNKIARRLESDYEARHGAKSTSELRQFVNKLPGYQAEQQSLKLHTSLTEEIFKHTRSEFFNRVLEVQQNIAAGADPSYQHNSIEELIARDVPLEVVLRLLCLESVISGGLKSKDLENFKHQILQAYGYQHVLTFSALEKLQLLQSRASTGALLIPQAAGGSGLGSKTNYNSARRALHLIVDEVNESSPEDIAYVYSGYAPLSIRLVQCILQKQQVMALSRGNSANAAAGAVSAAATGWRGFEDVLKNIRGRTFDEVQRGEDKAVKARQILNGSIEKKTVYVMFLGGITFTEIAALRFIAKQEEAKRRIVICTTSIISGNKAMDAAIEKRTFKAE